MSLNTGDHRSGIRVPHTRSVPMREESAGEYLDHDKLMAYGEYDTTKTV
jgi:hypothetical protein